MPSDKTFHGFDSAGPASPGTFGGVGSRLGAGLGWLLRMGAGALRLLRRGRGAAMRRLGQEIGGVHEELFRIRGELSLARTEIERVRGGAGRRDTLALPDLLRLGARREVKAIIRAHCRAVPLPDGTVLCRVLGRYKFLLDGHDKGLAPHLLLDGFWEYWGTEFVCRNLGRGEVALDVGASYGYYTAVLADLVGPEGRVHAFEPNPGLHALLARNLALNGFAGRVRTHAAAVGEGPGEVRLHELVGQPASSVVVRGLPPPAPSETPPPGVRAHAVPALALDGLDEARVDFIKIDAPGAEEVVWQGMQGLLRRNPGLRVLLSFNPLRHRDPAALLAEIGRRFPLRVVDKDARAKPVTAEELLASQRGVLLFLSQAEPR